MTASIPETMRAMVLHRPGEALRLERRPVPRPGRGQVLLRVEARGLTPGWHGMHLHAKGDCSKSDFTSAGPHVHGPAAAVHGLLNPAATETGDLDTNQLVLPIIITAK